ncbi:glucose-6-phosphate dehydrogenase [Roseibium aggregatum]|uniref:Glucose-6-phosphate 1-dehydrogenase n=1 Tax=Roseibium aggregatum TaxID=187304 RepID=A0A939J0V0_9HYPH|nr:glucose-6-phosphate dehydrogenase [Roseibium aggregatum]MBN9671471.1 glucose-6-phosphate dehydrogenase [Roseibium aggregatum]
MAVRVIEVEEFDLIVFGASGDLAHRKLMPALYHRAADGQMPHDARIVCSARRDYTDEEFRDYAKNALQEHVKDLEDEPLEMFLNRLRYVKTDAASGEGFEDLKVILEERPDVTRAFYLAVGPDLFGTICEHLGEIGVVNDHSRVVMEKPIGKDGASARALNDTVGAVFSEDQIFRIDHYLGKETVQNLMALRFANALFEPLWNAAHIDHVQITVAESLGVGGRAGYYDTAGALRDMVQNHILQLLCLVAMEPPESMNADSVRDEKLKVLKALAPITEQNAQKLTVRGQYRAGASAGGAVPGYLEELGHTESQTETFVALKAEIANWRWAGVPFYLRTGKRLARRVSEIVVQFQPIPHSIFDAEAGAITANRLIIRLQPDEGVQMQIMIKDPGPGGMRLRQVPLDMSFAEAFKVRNPDAYERLIMDVIRGNQTLFMRRDEVDAAWAWIDPIQAAWASLKDAPKGYTAGTWGPSASIALVERDGRTWAEDDGV